MPAEDGATLRDHYDQIERATGKRPPEARGPELPAAAAHLWHWFRELRAGDTKITHQEIEAWSRLNGITLERWEVRALRLLYQLLMGIIHDQPKPAFSMPDMSDD